MDNSGSQARPSYQIWRDWLSCAATAGVAESRASSASDDTMMQRWLKEPMREQPYNNIGAVLEKDHPKNSRPATREGETGNGCVAESEREQRKANEQ